MTSERIDNMIMKEIVYDITAGNLLTDADDATLSMMLIHMQHVKEHFRENGVIIGEA